MNRAARVIEKPHATANVRMNERRLCFAIALLLLLAGAAAHVIYLIANCPLDLAGDEAHYWEWSRRLDWSYYSKGPLVAYIIALGRALLGRWSVAMVGSEALAVRLPAVVLSVLTGIGLYRLAVETLGRPKLALAATAVTFTIPILSVGAVLMTIDAPLACLWTWGLVVAHRALLHDRPPTWMLLGVLIALGILAKYTMVLMFGVVGIAILALPRFRPLVRRPGPYVAAIIGLAGLAPIVIWNAGHDWVSFRHVSGQAGVAGGVSIAPAGPVEYLAGQLAVVSPLWFVAMVIAVVAIVRAPVDAAVNENHRRESSLLLVIAAIVPWCAFLLFSPITKIQPNWPVLSIFPAIILVCLWLSRLLRRPGQRSRSRAFCIAAAVVGAGMVLVAHRSELLMPLYARLARNAPPWDLTPVAKYDPAARLRGWSQLGAAVGDVLEHERAAGRDPFILADDYQVASEIAFYCPGHPNVYCAQAAVGGRRSQYDIWPNPLRDAADFIGRPVIYVGDLHAEIVGGKDSPPALPSLQRAQTVEHRVRGQLERVSLISTCGSFAGFPAESTALRKF